jgi:hypothetical protein
LENSNGSSSDGRVGGIIVRDSIRWWVVLPVPHCIDWRSCHFNFSLYIDFFV